MGCRHCSMNMIDKVNLSEKFNLFSDHWKPKIVGRVNSTQVKIAKLLGEFEWHHHEKEDEMFLVIHGELTIELRDGTVLLGEGELAVIPHGIEHRPIARKEVLVMLVEPETTVNTGNRISNHTADAEWI